jgi:hypothetical protein
MRAFFHRLSSVYIIGDGHHVKIGYSTDVDARLRDLQTGNGRYLRLHRIVDGGQKVEKWFHRKFKPQRLHGEWFVFHPDMLTVTPPDEMPSTLERRRPPPSMSEDIEKAYDENRITADERRELHAMLRNMYQKGELFSEEEGIRFITLTKRRAA